MFILRQTMTQQPNYCWRFGSSECKNIFGSIMADWCVREPRILPWQFDTRSCGRLFKVQGSTEQPNSKMTGAYEQSSISTWPFHWFLECMRWCCSEWRRGWAWNDLFGQCWWCEWFGLNLIWISSGRRVMLDSIAPVQPQSLVHEMGMAQCFHRVEQKQYCSYSLAMHCYSDIFFKFCYN